jgi:uncharacterized protein
MHAMTTSHDRVLKVADLVDAPGASRRVDLDVPVPEGFDVPLVTLSEPLHLSGVLESVVDGLLVRGELAADIGASCARCLEPVTERVVTDVVELFQDPRKTPTEDLEAVDEGYEIRDGQIDLDALLRDALAPALPTRPLCRDDCAGLCAQCGANRNDAPCDCAETDHDPRWAALEGLQLPAAAADTSDGRR